MDLYQHLKKLSIKEKLSLLTGDGLWNIKHYPKLGLKRFMMTDGPHGIRKQKSNDALGIAESYIATCFPTASLLACSFDESLLYEVGQALAQEAINQDVSMILGPGINIKRSPLCGRNFEYFSEDPVVAGILAKSYIEGVQSKQVGVSLKHYLANNQEKNRMTIDTIVDKRALYEIYLKGFGIAIQAKPWSIMTSYNQVNGKYVAESKLYLTAIARNRFEFKGAFITDWGAMNDRVQSLKAGLSLEMPGSKNKVLINAYKKGLITDKEIDNAVKPILWMLEKASVEKHKTNQYYHDVALKAALESIVLLKNDDDILPLKKQESIALIGAFFKQPRFQGSGSSKVNPVTVDTLIDQFEFDKTTFEYASGYHVDNHEDDTLIDEALKIIKNKDKVILSVGLTDSFESEGFDRTHMNLPIQQLKLIERVCDNHPNVIIILQGGAPTLMPYKDQVKTIINAYLPGEAGGNALYQILYGLHNPSGKLAESYPLKLDDTPSYPFFPGGTKSVYYAESIYVGYRYYDKKGLMVNYPFGHGLSYTSFKYDNLTLSTDTLNEKDALTISFKLTNTGDCDGKEVVQVYITDLSNDVHKPSQELKAFKKVLVKKQSSELVQIELPYDDFNFYDVDIDDFRVKQGEYEIRVGSSSRDIRLTSTLYVQGDVIEPQAPSVYDMLDRYISVHDFELIYGELPLRDDNMHHKFHLNSTIKDIKHTRIGSMIYKIGIKEMNKIEVDDTTKRMMKEQFESLPLRAMPLFSKDKFSYNRVCGLVKLLNKDISGITKLIRG